MNTRNLLLAALAALRSYEHGNAAPKLAAMVANDIERGLAKAKPNVHDVIQHYDNIANGIEQRDDGANVENVVIPLRFMDYEALCEEIADLTSRLDSRTEIARNDDFGLRLSQEPKYTVSPLIGRLVNRATGIAIPDDEPLMLFRAQDIHAAPVIRHYCDLVTNAEGIARSPHQATCFGRYQEFVNFAEQHPERMKTPDTAP